MRAGRPSARPASLKPQEFESQKEYRFAFEPVSQKIKPVVAKIPPLKKCCRWHSERPQE
jgi:hypothetical protein